MSELRNRINDQLTGSQIADLRNTLGVSRNKLTRILNNPMVECNKVKWIKILANLLGEECACDFAIQYRLGFEHKQRPIGFDQMEELAQLDGYTGIKVHFVEAVV